MRAYFDVTHPAHVHLFRNAIAELAAEGHEVAVGSREKEVTTDLLDAHGIDHRVLSTKGDSQLGLPAEWTARTARTARLLRAFDPDVVVSQLNPAAPVAAALTDATSVVFHDSETAGRLANVVGSLADVVCSPVGVDQDLGDHHRHYEGFHELAYLHPDRFEPDRSLLAEYGVDPNEDYAVLRFVSMGAYHDVGAAGLTRTQKRDLAATLGEHGPVYVSSEGPLPADLRADLPAEPVPVPPAAIHHLLAEASVFVGDSDTMAIEAGLLGTPSVRVDCFGDGVLGVFDELASYDLVESTTDAEEAIETASRLAADGDAGARWTKRRNALLADKLDVTTYQLAVIDEVVGDADDREPMTVLHGPDGGGSTNTSADTADD